MVVERPHSIDAQSFSIPGWSQEDCFKGRGSGIHCQMMLTTAVSIVSNVDLSYRTSQSARISAWREVVPAADAKKAGRASDDMRLTSRLPSFIGRLA